MDEYERKFRSRTLSSIRKPTKKSKTINKKYNPSAEELIGGDAESLIRSAMDKKERARIAKKELNAERRQEIYKKIKKNVRLAGKDLKRAGLAMASEGLAAARKAVPKLITPVNLGFAADNKRARQLAMYKARAAALARKQVLGSEQQYLKQQLLQQQAMQRQPRPQNIAALNAQQAKFAKYYGLDDNQQTEIDAEGTTYANKFNQKLLRAKAYFDAIERKRRYNERPRNWEARRDMMRQREIQRIRDAARRTNLMNATRDGPRAPRLFVEGPDSDSNVLNAPNLFSKNNPRNQNVFNEQGKRTILQAENVFRRDISEFNPLNAEHVFNGSNNVFSGSSNQMNNQDPRKRRRMSFWQA